MMTRFPPYRWPDGKRCAVVVSIDVDGETPYFWRTRRQPHRTLAEPELRRFGPRVGLGRLVDLLDTLDIRGSFFVPGLIAELYPWILPDLVERGHEIGLHGYAHENVQELSASDNARILDKAIDIFRRQTGRLPEGYRSPAWELTREMPDLLRQRSLRYDSSLMGFDHPYAVAGLPEIPVNWSTDDAVYFLYAGNGTDLWPPRAPGEVLAHWQEEWEAVRQEGGLMMITLHPWVSGRAARVHMLRRLLETIRSSDDTWITTAGALAAYHVETRQDQRFDVPPDDGATHFPLEIEGEV